MKPVTGPDGDNPITDAHLRALFLAHCECRPLDVDRAEDEHLHDCDTGILDHIQTAMNALDADEQCAAVCLCEAHWNTDLRHAVYAPRLSYAWNARNGDGHGDS